MQAAKDAWAGEKQVLQAAGFNFAYERQYEPTETDFTADIVQMRAKGVKLVIEIAVDVKAMTRIQSAAQQQNWKSCNHCNPLDRERHERTCSKR